MFRSLCWLYAALMVHAMVHVRMQRYFVAWFRAQRLVMHNYSIELAHVPPWMNNEKNLLRALSEEGLSGRFIGVSIAYDYRDHVDEINEMWERIVVQQDSEYNFNKSLEAL